MKIAICTPVHGDTRAGYTFSLAAMLLETVKQRPDLELKVFYVSCSNVAVGRQRLVEKVVDWDGDWLLWIDSDHDFPPDSLIRLLAHDEPFIGCNQSRREQAATPTAGIGEELVYTTPKKVQDGEVETVDWLGLAFCLVSMRALQEADLPLFQGVVDEGEDVIFCIRMKEAGYPPKVDHRLSAQVGHIGLTRYTTGDSVKQKQIRAMSADIERRRREAAARTA
jgi:hypothetical protein